MLLIYGTSQCPWCDRAKELAESYSTPYYYHDIGNDLDKREFIKSEGHRTVPQCYFKSDDNMEHIGGYEKLKEYLSA